MEVGRRVEISLSVGHFHRLVFGFPLDWKRYAVNGEPGVLLTVQMVGKQDRFTTTKESFYVRIKLLLYVAI